MTKNIKYIYLILLFPIIILSQEKESSIYFSMGSDLMQENSYEEALKYFRKSIKNNESKIKDAIIESGYCCKMLGDYKEAIKFGKEALQFELADWEKGRVYLLIGECYSYLENYETAFYYFNLMKKTTSIYEIPEEFIFVKDGWFFITQLNYDDIYYKKNTVKKSGNGKIKIWIKYYWNGKTVTNEDLENISKNGGSSEVIEQVINKIKKNRENVSYTLQYEEYDFINNRIRLMDVIKYDDKGNVLQNISFESMEKDNFENSWSNIVPNSVGENILNTLKRKFYR